MKKLDVDITENFYQSSSDWAYDMYQSQTVWLRRFICALIIVTIFLFMSLLCNILLIPLKEKVPYLYAFDHATGEITKIGTLETTKLTAEWSLTRYLLIQYIINYESFNIKNVEQPYRLVWAQSDDEIKAHYESQVKSSNPESPYRKYGKDKYITVRVLAINRLNEDTVNAKFEKILHDNLSHTEQVLYKEAIVKWKYSEGSTDQKTLDRDPLGFKVTYYQTSQVNLDNN